MAILPLVQKGLSWKNAILKLYNTLGQLALEEHVNKANATNHTISVDKLSIGVYQLEVFTDDKRYSTKIIIE